MFTVRSASIADVPQLRSLEQNAFDSLSNYRGVAQLLDVSPRIDNEWNDVLADGKFRTLVGESEGIIQGYLLVEIFSSLHKALIKQVYVSASARELGLGAQLLEHCERIARQAGCTVLEGLALPGDREMKNLFERSSMSAQLLIVGKSLD
jgi:GNAT superfamily N-acetyltransferase